MVWSGEVGVGVVGYGSGDIVWTGGAWGRGLYPVGRVVRSAVRSVESKTKDKIM